MHNGRLILNQITATWVQAFMDRNNIIGRAQTGKLMVSAAKKEFIERCVAYHLGQMKKQFESGELEEDTIENMDETHFIINMDNGKTLGFKGDNTIKYSDVVSGGTGMTMVVRIVGGKNATITAPFMIFKNENSSYPIKGVSINTHGVSYRSSPKGFMTRKIFTAWLKEPRANWADLRHRKKFIYCDNVSSHNVTAETIDALGQLNAELRKLPANSTHLTQPCDSFVISKIKDAWTARWEKKKLELIKDNEWQGEGGSGSSGKLKNPGWSYFLQLAVDSVQDVNAMKDKNGLTYARKAMIRCRLGLDIDGHWHEGQLSRELQEIIKKYRENFDGKPVPGTEEEEELEYESDIEIEVIQANEESEEQTETEEEIEPEEQTEIEPEEQTEIEPEEQAETKEEIGTKDKVDTEDESEESSSNSIIYVDLS